MSRRSWHRKTQAAAAACGPTLQVGALQALVQLVPSFVVELHVPAGHREHEVEPARENLPAGQSAESHNEKDRKKGGSGRVSELDAYQHTVRQQGRRCQPHSSYNEHAESKRDGRASAMKESEAQSSTEDSPGLCAGGPRIVGGASGTVTRSRHPRSAHMLAAPGRFRSPDSGAGCGVRSQASAEAPAAGCSNTSAKHEGHAGTRQAGKHRGRHVPGQLVQVVLKIEARYLPPVHSRKPFSTKSSLEGSLKAALSLALPLPGRRQRKSTSRDVGRKQGEWRSPKQHQVVGSVHHKVCADAGARNRRGMLRHSSEALAGAAPHPPAHGRDRRCSARWWR